MKRILTIVLALLVVAVPAFANQYGWSISSSQTDPTAHIGGIPIGAPASLYLWYSCSDNGGMTAMECSVQATGIFATGFTPMNGFLNAAAFPMLQLAVGGCPTGSVVAGSIAVFYLGGAGSACVVNSPNGIRVTVDCGTPVPTAWDLNAVGWDALVAPACTEELCHITATAAQDWGAIKSLYR